ncbi:MAG: hypothetical protein QXV28_08115 [Ignisphaera sp.]
MSATDKVYEKGKVHEYEAKYVPKKFAVDRSIMYLEFPLHAYWREASTIPDLQIRNAEGLIYPSYTILIYAEKYKIEQVEPTKFHIHTLSGYTPCVLCGKVFKAEISNTEVDVKKPIKNYHPEVAYELALTTIAPELAKKVKSHIIYTHNHKFDVIGKERVLIIRNVGTEDIVVTSTITAYRCQSDDAKVYGVLGMLDHVVSNHERTEITNKVVEFVEKVNKTTHKLVNIGKENIPILGAFRNTFSYVAVESTGYTGYRLLALEYLTRWLVLKAVEREGRVDIIASTSIPRAVRGIYHHPLFRYAILEIAYKVNPKKYNLFMIETKRALRKRGYSTERLDRMDSLITGALAYTPIEPKHAFDVNIDVLESVREKLEEKAVNLKLFLSNTFN